MPATHSNASPPDFTEKFRNRLLAMVALKEYAIANNLALEPEIWSQINQLCDDFDGPLTVERQNQLDTVVTQLTKKTYPTGLDTVGISPDAAVRTAFDRYRMALAAIGILMMTLAVWSYYSCRVSALSGDLATRIKIRAELLAGLVEAKRTLHDVESEHSRESTELDLASIKLRELKTSQASETETTDLTLEVKSRTQAVEELQKKVDVAKQAEAGMRDTLDQFASEIAWAELWPSCFAGTLGALGACTYLLYRLIGAYSQARMTITSLYSELLRLPIGAIVGWILYVGFCQQAFRTSFLAESEKLDIATQSLLLLPFLAGYSSRLVVELLNRVIDGVRTSFGLKPTEDRPATQ